MELDESLGSAGPGAVMLPSSIQASGWSYQFGEKFIEGSTNGYGAL